MKSPIILTAVLTVFLSDFNKAHFFRPASALVNDVISAKQERKPACTINISPTTDTKINLPASNGEKSIDVPSVSFEIDIKSSEVRPLARRDDVDRVELNYPSPQTGRNFYLRHWVKIPAGYDWLTSELTTSSIFVEGRTLYIELEGVDPNPKAGKVEISLEIPLDGVIKNSFFTTLQVEHTKMTIRNAVGTLELCVNLGLSLPNLNFLK